jgi:hypothetical protein
LQGQAGRYPLRGCVSASVHSGGLGWFIDPAKSHRRATIPGCACASVLCEEWDRAGCWGEHRVVAVRAARKTTRIDRYSVVAWQNHPSHRKVKLRAAWVIASHCALGYPTNPTNPTYPTHQEGLMHAAREKQSVPFKPPTPRYFGCLMRAAYGQSRVAISPMRNKGWPSTHRCRPAGLATAVDRFIYRPKPSVGACLAAGRVSPLVSIRVARAPKGCVITEHKRGRSMM